MLMQWQLVSTDFPLTKIKFHVFKLGPSHGFGCVEPTLGGPELSTSHSLARMEQCASASLEWAQNNVVRFEMTKTEAILFSRKRKHRRCQVPIQVEDQTIHFAPEVTRWLGIWPGSALTLQENRRRRVERIRQAGARIRRIVNQYGVPPAAARGLQLPLVQGTMLYASEITWGG